jgi:hypothetical protein
MGFQVLTKNIVLFRLLVRGQLLLTIEDVIHPRVIYPLLPLEHRNVISNSRTNANFESPYEDSH